MSISPRPRLPPPKTPDRLILCANNEYASLDLAYPSLRAAADVTAEQIEALIAAVGVGSKFPARPNDSEENRRMNRRVEVQIIDLDPKNN